MSYYYNFYPAIKRADGKVDVYCDKKIVLDWYSRSFFNAEMLYDFPYLKEENMTDALKKQFTFKNWENKEEISDLRIMSKTGIYGLKSNFVKTGYYLIEDVKRYQQDPDSLWNLEVFYDHISPEVYAALLTSRPHGIMKKDCEGTEYLDHGADDYMFFAYPDYTSDEYKAFKWRILYEMLEDNAKLEDGEEIVFVEDEG